VQLDLEGKAAKTRKQIKKARERAERKRKGVYGLKCFHCSRLLERGKVSRWGEKGIPVCEECFANFTENKLDAEIDADCGHCEICDAPIGKGENLCRYHKL
jgi:hypothetical protein